MAYRHFPTKNQAELEALLRQVEDRILANVASAAANGQTVAFSQQRLDETLKDRLYADLSQLDPDTYPPANQRTTRTVPSFS